MSSHYILLPVREKRGKGKGVLNLKGTIEPNSRGVCIVRFEQIVGTRPPFTAKLKHLSLEFDFEDFGNDKVYSITAAILLNKPSVPSAPFGQVDNVFAATPDLIVHGLTRMFKKPYFESYANPGKIVYNESKQRFEITLPPFSRIFVEKGNKPNTPPLLAMMGFPYDNAANAMTLVNSTSSMKTFYTSNLQTEHSKEESLGRGSALIVRHWMTEILGLTAEEQDEFQFNKQVLMTFEEFRGMRAAVDAEVEIPLKQLVNKTRHELDETLNNYLDDLCGMLNLPDHCMLCANGLIQSASSNVNEFLVVTLNDNLVELLRCSEKTMKFNLKKGSPKEHINYYSTGNSALDTAKLFPITIITPGTTPNCYLEGYGNTCVVAQYQSKRSPILCSDFVIHLPSGYLEFLFLGPDLNPSKVETSVLVNMIVTIKDRPFKSSL